MLASTRCWRRSFGLVRQLLHVDGHDQRCHRAICSVVPRPATVRGGTACLHTRARKQRGNYVRRRAFCRLGWPLSHPPWGDAGLVSQSDVPTLTACITNYASTIIATGVSLNVLMSLPNCRSGGSTPTGSTPTGSTPAGSSGTPLPALPPSPPSPPSPPVSPVSPPPMLSCPFTSFAGLAFPAAATGCAGPDDACSPACLAALSTPFVQSGTPLLSLRLPPCGCCPVLRDLREQVCTFSRRPLRRPRSADGPSHAGCLHRRSRRRHRRGRRERRHA